MLTNWPWILVVSSLAILLAYIIMLVWLSCIVIILHFQTPHHDAMGLCRILSFKLQSNRKVCGTDVNIVWLEMLKNLPGRFEEDSLPLCNVRLSRPVNIKNIVLLIKCHIRLFNSYLFNFLSAMTLRCKMFMKTLTMRNSETHNAKQNTLIFIPCI